MPGPTTPITDREKAAILAYNLGILPDAKTAYIVAEDKAVKDVPEKALKSMISKWINSPKFEQYDQYINRLLADRDADARKRGRQEAEKARTRQTETGGQDDRTTGRNERTENKPAANIDYYDPVNQRTQINRIIAESGDDPKTQLDAIKAIQQTQRDDKQAARDQKQVRSYLPLRCESCPLYTKAGAKATK